MKMIRQPIAPVQRSRQISPTDLIMVAFLGVRIIIIYFICKAEHIITRKDTQRPKAPIGMPIIHPGIDIVKGITSGMRFFINLTDNSQCRDSQQISPCTSYRDMNRQFIFHQRSFQIQQALYQSDIESSVP